MRALYLQQAVCLLPDTKLNSSELGKLALRIHEFDGEKTLLRVLAQSEAWEQEIQTRLELGRNARHEKIQEEIKKFIDEIHFEEHRKRFTLEELEELEEKLETLRRWFEKLKDEDPGVSPMARRSKVNLKEASDRLDQFAAKVEQFQKETRTPPVKPLKGHRVRKRRAP